MENIIAQLLQDFEHGKVNRRQLIRSLAVAGTALSVGRAMPAAAYDRSLIKAANINHISIQTPDYATVRDFYAGILGAQVLNDDGKSCSLLVGETTLMLRYPSVRRPAVAGADKVNHGSDRPGVDHISYTMANWDTDPRVEEAIRAELKRLGLPAGQDQRPGQSRTFHIDDPFGLGIQMGGKSQI